MGTVILNETTDETEKRDGELPEKRSWLTKSKRQRLHRRKGQQGLCSCDLRLCESARRSFSKAPTELDRRQCTGKKSQCFQTTKHTSRNGQSHTPRYMYLGAKESKITPPTCVARDRNEQPPRQVQCAQYLAITVNGQKSSASFSRPFGVAFGRHHGLEYVCIDRSRRSGAFPRFLVFVLTHGYRVEAPV